MTFPMHLHAAERTDKGPVSGDRPQRGRIHLTPRERQIIHLVGCGCSNAEIAERLSLRPQTVKNRLSEIYQKTGSRNRVDLT
ncbi:MAG: LuxR C-terminal-related transcriptional regulator, partial [Vicinamibacterales bacterium]